MAPGIGRAHGVHREADTLVTQFAAHTPSVLAADN
jgi:hypothetical protein